jgi:SAM-dependent methyltransferase
MYGVPILICYSYVARPLRFGLAVGAFLVASAQCEKLEESKVIKQERSFFGVLKVQDDSDSEGEYHKLVHGTTLHGKQYLDPALRREPLTYYHRTGPIGDIFRVFEGPQAKKDMAFIGLGSGTLACYGDEGKRLTFYDIDQAVVKIAENPEYFTYYQDCKDRGTDVHVVLGDARLRLEDATDDQYDLMVIDAFSSDAIPIHLITREAIQLYFQKLQKNGLLAVHISNRYLDLQPVLGNLAKDLKLVGRCRYDSDEEKHPGKASSEWVILARQEEDLGALAKEENWKPIRTNPEVGVWTDDYSNLLRVLEWRK